MKFIGRMLRNEMLSLSTLFLVVIPFLNHVMVAHGAPDLSHFSLPSFSGGLGGIFSGLAGHAGSVSMDFMQAGSGASALYINNGPIFLN